MKKLSKAVLGLHLALATGMATGARAEDAPSCGLKLLSALDMTAVDDRFAVPVTVDGHALSFLMDTGGLMSTIRPEAIDKDNTQRYPTHVETFGVESFLLDTFMVARSFQVGALTGKDYKMLVETRPLSIDGTISPDHCPGNVIYWPHKSVAAIPFRVEHGHIQISVQVDGRKLSAILDTGTSDSILNEDTAERYLGITKNSAGVTATPDKMEDGVGRFLYPFKAMDFGGVAVQNPVIGIVPNTYLHDLGQDMIVGMNILGKLHLYISYKEKILYVTPAD